MQKEQILKKEIMPPPLPEQRQKNRAGDENRTHVSSLEGWCSTIELHPHHL